MYYDPIKNIFAEAVKHNAFLRKLFYKILNLMFLRSWYVRKQLKKIRLKFQSKHIDILDAGTGYAQYSYFMYKYLQPANILAVDVKEDWIEDCKAFFEKEKIKSVKFQVADLTEITFENQFDLIVCVDVMEHIVDDVIVFNNYYRALKPGGFLLINTPSVFGGSDVHDDEDESFIGEHARDGYSKEDLMNKLSPLGFQLYKAQYTYGFWGNIAWKFGIKYPMIMLNLSKLFFIILPVYYIITFPFTYIMMNLDFYSNNKIGSGINLIVQKPVK